MGLDSLMAVELRHSLGSRAGRELPLTLTFNYPNVAALTQYLSGLLFAAAQPPAATDHDADEDDGEPEGDDDLVRRLQAKLREVQA
jgi:hypothetical protein